MIDTEISTFHIIMGEYEKMSWKTPSDELEDAIDNLITEVKRLRELLGETEYRLEMAEDVLSLSDWIVVYNERIKGDEE